MYTVCIGLFHIIYGTSHVFTSNTCMLYCLTYIISALRNRRLKQVSSVVGSVVGAIMRAYNFYEVYDNFSTYILTLAINHIVITI